jgi:hypothetical protein
MNCLRCIVLTTVGGIGAGVGIGVASIAILKPTTNVTFTKPDGTVVARKYVGFKKVEETVVNKEKPNAPKAEDSQ